MLQHILTLSFRNFFRYKSAFFINLISLTAGLMSALFIFLWVADEMSVDKFHKKDAQLYQVMKRQNRSGTIHVSTYTPGPLAAALQEELPEVEAATTIIWWFDQFTFSVGEQNIATKGYYARPEFFEIFTYPLLRGSAKMVLDDPNSIAISQSTAEKLFGSIDSAYGQTLQVDRQNDFLISGIFEDVPSYSTQQFDFIISYEKFIQEPRFANYLNWNVGGPSTILTLQQGVDINATTEKINQLVAAQLEDKNYDLFLKPYAENYLYGQYENGELAGGRIIYVRLFSMIGLFILLIACVNFMNLSTARSSRRSKEVGLKKTMGARRKTLVFQYLTESLLLAFIAFICALGIVVLLLPEFNILTNKSIVLELSPNLLALFLGFVALTGLLAGSYPALYLSSFQPITVLRGFQPSSWTELWMRRGLVVFQYSVSIVLIIAVLVVFKQIQFVQNRNLGYDQEQLIQILLNIQDREKIGSFLSEAKRLPGVINISSGNSPINHQNRTGGLHWEGKNPNDDLSFYNFRTYYDLLETMDVKLKAGRLFSREYGEEAHKLIFNETAIVAMGLQNPIGKTITFGEGEPPHEIIGVVEDFHFQSLHETIKPLFFHLQPQATPLLMARLETGKEQESLAALELLYQKFNPGVPFSFDFLDQEYGQLYESEQRVAVLSKYFALLAILISCLGLFGLAAFTAEKRSKEISIRKILGASVPNLVGLLSKDFLKLVLFAFVIAAPMAWYLMNDWLSAFAYRINMGWSVFIITGVLAIFMALFAVGFQAIKAALVNPIERLRGE